MTKTPTQNDWRNEFQGWAFDHDRRYFRSVEGKRLMRLINKLLADARKEVMLEVRDVISKLKIITPEREPPKNKLTQNQIFASGQMNMLVRLNDVLATLRKETK